MPDIELKRSVYPAWSVTLKSIPWSENVSLDGAHLKVNVKRRLLVQASYAALR